MRSVQRVRLLVDSFFSVSELIDGIRNPELVILEIRRCCSKLVSHSLKALLEDRRLVLKKRPRRGKKVLTTAFY